MRAFLKNNFKILVLLFTILLDVFGFFGLISSEFEILDKIIAWVVFSYFFYELSVSKMLFGIKYKIIDFILVFAYFNLVTKNFIIFFNEILPSLKSQVIYDLVNWFVTNDVLLQLLTFYLGAILIIFVSYFTARYAKYTKESIYSKLVGDKTFENNTYIGAVEKSPHIMLKVIIAFLLYNAFFLVVFNLLIEWLGFIEDDLITIISIVIMVIIFKKYSGNIKTPGIIEKITNIADDFYGNIISSINRKRYVMLLCTGLLSLQILTDFFVFVSPILLGKNEISYFGNLDGHVTFINAMLNDIAINPTFLLKSGIFLAYVLNGIFIVFLMVMPLYIWYLTYTEKKEHIPTPLIVLFFMSLASFALKPIIHFQSLNSFSGGQYNVFGVDIMIRNLMGSFNTPIFYLLLISVLAGFLSYALYKIFKKLILFIFTLINFSFILTYVYFFMKGVLGYYINEILVLQEIGAWLIVFYFYIFVIILIIFYLTALISLVREINFEFDFFNNSSINSIFSDEISESKIIYTQRDNMNYMQEHPMLKHLKSHVLAMIILFIVFIFSVIIEIEELTGIVKFSTNFIIEDLVLLILSGVAIFMILSKIRHMRDKHFKEHNHIRFHINKKIFPIAFSVLLIVLSTLFMAVRDKSRAFNLFDFAIDKDWIHVILFNMILLLYLYVTFILKKKDNNKT
jgi:hypothetical protein